MSDNTDDQGDGEWDDKSDLTRLEDLSEFLHEDDPEVDAKLKAAGADIGSEDATLPEVPLPDFTEEEEESSGFEAESPESMDLSELEEDEENSYQEFNGSSEPEDNSEQSFDSGDGLEDTQAFEVDQVEEEELDSQNFDFNSEEQSFDSGDLEDSELFGDDDGEQGFDNEEEQSFDSEDQEESELFGDDDGEQGFDNEEEQSFDSDEDGEQGFDNEEEQSFDSDEDGEQGFDNEEEQSFDPEEESFTTPNDFQLPEPEELEGNQDQPTITAALDQPSEIQHTQREDFQDLRDFGNAITYGAVKTGGNPPFSLILRNIRTVEDAEDIKIILNEHGLVSPDNEQTIDQGLEQGSLLISQISEYSAVFLAHKMRRFDVELRIGLSDQLHPSKSYSREGRGLVSKYNLDQNKSEHLETENHSISIEDIKLSTTPTLDGYVIKHYLQVITSHSLIEESELRRLHQISNPSSEFNQSEEVELENILDQFPKDELEPGMEAFDLGLNEVYRELVEELRNQAYKIEANAVVGINFNITPMVFKMDSNSQIHYKIICSGNAVWVVDLP